MPFPRRTWMPALLLMPALLAPVLAGLPALAQVAAPSGIARRPAVAPPAPPAPAPPAPPDLNRAPRPAIPTPVLPLMALPPSMQNLPAGGWRIDGAPARGEPDAATTRTLAEIARRLAAIPRGRVTLVAQVAGPSEDLSLARRAALANAQAVRRLLEAGGLAGTRIDLRPIGRTAEARDAIELLPPGAPSPILNAAAAARPVAAPPASPSPATSPTPAAPAPAPPAAASPQAPPRR